VLFRPSLADGLPDAVADEVIARIRRALLEAGTAVVGRAAMPTGAGGTDQLWLKLTLLHPYATVEDYRSLLDLIVATKSEASPNHQTEESPVAS